MKNRPAPNRQITANEKFPNTGIALYQAMFVGKSQKKSDKGMTNEKMWYLGSSKYFYKGKLTKIPYREWYKAKRHLAYAEELRKDIQLEKDYSFYMGVVAANKN